MYIHCVKKFVVQIKIEVILRDFATHSCYMLPRKTPT